MFSIPEDVIKKGRPHGHRNEKKSRDKEYYQAHNLKKEMPIKENSKESMIDSCEADDLLDVPRTSSSSSSTW